MRRALTGHRSRRALSPKNRDPGSHVGYSVVKFRHSASMKPGALARIRIEKSLRSTQPPPQGTGSRVFADKPYGALRRLSQ